MITTIFETCLRLCDVTHPRGTACDCPPRMVSLEASGRWRDNQMQIISLHEVDDDGRRVSELDPLSCPQETLTALVSAAAENEGNTNAPTAAVPVPTNANKTSTDTDDLILPGGGILRAAPDPGQHSYSRDVLRKYVPGYTHLLPVPTEGPCAVLLVNLNSSGDLNRTASALAGRNVFGSALLTTLTKVPQVPWA